MQYAALSWKKVGLGLALVVLVQLFFVGASHLVRAEEAPITETQQSVNEQTTSEPSQESMGLPEFITETLAPLVDDVINPQPPVEEQPVIEEVPAQETSPEEPAVEEPVSEEPVVETLAQAEVTTDKEDYHPGETASIFGRFFTALTDFVVKIFGSDENNQNYTETEINVTADEEGNFDTTYTLDDLYRPFYEVVVSTLAGEKVAETWFRDAAVGLYDQCSNDQGTGYTTGDTGCRWTNGNIQANNSKYFEGDSTVQRLWMEGYAPGTQHTVTFQYGTTKGGNHAYDYLTTWNASESWVTPADRCQDIVGCLSASETTLPMGDDPNVPLAIEPNAASRLFTMRGGTLDSVTNPVIVSGSYAGDSETSVTITFTVGAANGPMCSTKKVQGQDVTSCGVALWFGAHVAKTSEWQAFNNTTGAGTISGSPYHVALAAEDGTSVGQRDNQMQSAAVVLPSTIVIIKDTNPNAAQDFSFTTTGTGLSSFSLDDDNDSTLSNTKTFSGLTAGNYSVTESLSTGYSLTSLVCSDPTSNTSVNLGSRTASINVAAGETVTCTFTNTLQRARLTLVKTVTNDNGGTAQVGDWTLSASGPTPISGITGNPAVTNAEVDAGTYTLSESTGPAGYTAGTYSCVKNNGAPVVSNSITLAANDNAVCTINNNDNAPSLTLNKVVVNDDGGNAPESSWTLTADGGSAGTLSGPGASGSTDVISGSGFKAGTYSLSESTGPSGYTASSWTCTGTGSQNGSNITLALGQSAVCTITNDDQQARITVIKVVTNNNGGSAQPNDFDLTLEGNAVTSGVAVDVNPGTYTAGETLLPGYSFVGFSGDCDSNGDVTVALGEQKTCTLTNDDQQAYITVVKVVTNNNGGSAQPNEFALKLEGVSVTSGVAVPVNPGTYTASETLLPGYSFVGFTGDCDSNGDVTVALGQNKTCTLTNDDQQAFIIIDKTVVNDNGGTAAPNDFLLTVNGQSVSDGVAYPVNPGTHTAGETQLPGYAASAWGTDCNEAGSVTVALGETKTCTITNNDIAPSLTLDKVVINDNGGTRSESQWTLLANGPTSFFGAGAAGSADVVSNADFDAGTYTLSESGPSDYTASSWTCTGTGSQNGTQITLGLGQSAVCTITNDDKAPSLTLNKVVINDNGGTATAENFTLTASGPTGFSGVGPSVSNGASFDAGTYDLSETDMFGYAASEWVCVGGTQDGSEITLGLGQSATCTITNNDIAPTLTLIKTVINDNGGTATASNFQAKIDGANVPWASAQAVIAGSHTASETTLPGYTASAWGGDCSTNGSVTLAVGENKTCTITNDDQQAYITVIKEVVNDNGGTATPNDFLLKLENSPVLSGQAYPVNPGTYTASEILLDGYSFVGFSGDCDSNGDVTVALGESKTCTLTNNDIAPILHLRKVVTNNNGGTATVSDFTLTANGTGDNDISGISPVDSGATLKADTFALSETNIAGYTASDWVCVGGIQNGANITLANGQEATCTITNDDNAPKLTLNKILVKDDGGTADESDWTLTASGPTNISGPGASGDADVVSGSGFVAGSYVLSESTGPSGYTASSWSCTNGDNDGMIQVNLGDDITCSITNDDQPGHLIVNKVTNPNDTTTQFSITASGGTIETPSANQSIVGGGSVDYTVHAGTYNVSEADLAGWDETSNTCVDVEVSNGETEQCTITNTQRGKIIVVKQTLPDGDATSFNFTASYDNDGFSLSDNQQNDSDFIVPGTYSVSEAVPTGWEQTSAACDDNSPVNAISVSPGETVTCAFNNTKKAKITIVKDAQPNDCQDFAFIMTGQSNFILDDNEGVVGCTDIDRPVLQAFSNLSPGSVIITETLPNQYWKQKSVNCVNNNAIASGFTSVANGVTVNLVAGSDVTCTFVNEKISPTRTIGFWQTHTAYTKARFDALKSNFYIGQDIVVGAGTHKGKLTTYGQLFGGFYASIPKTTTGAKRTDIDKARIQMLQQLIAAKLNCGTFGCTQSVKDLIAAADNAYATGTASQINSYTGQLDAYNNSGDTIQIGSAGKATPKDSQSSADLAFWNLP